ncbi:hypothetical protein ES703_117846 [subsurface metagenome]
MEQDLQEEAEVKVVAAGWVVPVQVLVPQASVFVLSVGPLFLIGRASPVIK